MKVYAVVYKAYPPKGVARTPLARSFVRLAGASPACYDGGDDPSFYSSEQLSRPVTWGVCRTPLRASVTSGDVVVFFARRPDNKARGISYLFKGFATVDRKISHVDIWTKPREAIFQDYLNLLIRPARGGTNRYRHWEPADDHCEDWLWRVCGPMRGRWGLFGNLGRVRRFVDGFTRLADGTTIRARPNYIVFSDSKRETVILSDPIEVAWSEPIGEGKLEEWLNDSRAHRIRDLTIGQSNSAVSGERGLKTRNRQQANPHLVLDRIANSSLWRERMRKAVDG